MNFEYKEWPYEKLDVLSAWAGLENYLFSIVKNLNIPPLKALEFGVDYGYSTHIFSKIFKEVIGVDTFLGDEHSGLSDKGDTFYKKVIACFKNTNVQIVRSTFENFIEKNTDFYNLIHIDIVHLYEPTFKCAEWAVNHSNVILLHDTVSHPCIYQVCSDLVSRYNLKFYNIPNHHGLGILWK
jgi:hypothetical protein